MREILSRGKRLADGEWIEGFYVRIYDSKGNVSHRIYPGYAESDCGEFYPEWFEVDPDTIGQYIGRCDKNGKNIFEGDILRRYSDYCEAYFSEGVVNYGKFNCGCCDGVYGWYLEGGDIRNLDVDAAHMDIEICGNIHDNPELLEVADATN